MESGSPRSLPSTMTQTRHILDMAHQEPEKEASLRTFAADPPPRLSPACASFKGALSAATLGWADRQRGHDTPISSDTSVLRLASVYTSPSEQFRSVTSYGATVVSGAKPAELRLTHAWSSLHTGQRVSSCRKRERSTHSPQTTEWPHLPSATMPMGEQQIRQSSLICIGGCRLTAPWHTCACCCLIAGESA